MSNSLDLLKTLVAFDTTSRESNLHLIEFVRDYLERFDVPCELVYNEQRSKANLFATIGPADRPGIVLSGHTDVVPVDGQPWTVAPFELTERDGKRLHVKPVSGKDRHGIAPVRVCGRPAAADISGIDDIIVDERRIVKELDNGGQADGGVGHLSEHLGRQQQ